MSAGTRALLSGMLLVLGFVADAQTNYTVLKSFGFPDQAGEHPDILVEGSDGALYGSAIVGEQLFWFGSPDNPQRSIVFKMRKDGGGYAVLHRFSDTNATVSGLDLRDKWSIVWDHLP